MSFSKSARSFLRRHGLLLRHRVAKTRRTHRLKACERLEPRLALAGDVDMGRFLQPATSLVLTPSMLGPSPVQFGKGDVVGTEGGGFVVTAVAGESIVEKWDAANNAWVDVSTVPTSADPHELLRLLAVRVIGEGDRLRWLPRDSSSPATNRRAFELIGWRGGQPAAGGAPANAPSAVEQLTIERTAARELTLTWSPVLGERAASSYTVRAETLKPTADSSGIRLASTSTTFVTADSSIVLPGLDPEAFHSFVVSANNGSGASPSSRIDGSSLLWQDHASTAPVSAAVSPPQPMAATGPEQTIPANVWFQFDSVLNDPNGRMSFQLPVTGASSALSGSINGLAFCRTASGGFLYAGASNGGVYMRSYNRSTNSWSPSWTWVSKPGSGYLGSQSIGQLAVSPDGQLLAVGQGNPSNFQSAIAVPGNGIQIGRISTDGTITWLSGGDSQLQGKNIRSLIWTSNTHLVASYQNLFDFNVLNRATNGTLVADVNSVSGIVPGSVHLQSPTATTVVLAEAPGGSVFSAGHAIVDGIGPANFVEFINSAGVTQPIGGADVYAASLTAAGHYIGRVAAYPTLVSEPGFATQQIIVFVGSYARVLNGESSDWIARADRLVIDPVTKHINAITTELLSQLVTVNGTPIIKPLVGYKQADTDLSYGNFSFAVDETDPSARAVFVGGNTGYPNAGQQRPSGGLVRVTVDGSLPTSTLGFYSQFAPDEQEGQFGPIVAPGSPHADSRTILFIDTPTGKSLIESDDGGVWQLDFGGDRMPGTSLWRTLTAPGMNTLEVYNADYNSFINVIAGAYQDNGNSVGQAGGNQRLLDTGDGQIAFFDDAQLDSFSTTSLYYSPQEYLQRGYVSRMVFDSSGREIQHLPQLPMYRDFYDALGNRVLLQENSPQVFGKPIEANAYRPGNIVMAGNVGLYEQLRPVASNALVFTEHAIFPQGFKPIIMSLDNQGSFLGTQSAFDSLYVAYGLTGDAAGNISDVRISGRQPGPNGLLGSFYSATTELAAIQGVVPEYVTYPNINDIAHRSVAGQPDVVYWLQGGASISPHNSSFPIGALTPQNIPQVLRMKSAGSAETAITTLDLAASGIHLNENDPWRLQSLVYVPANQTHGEKLVVAGRGGMWIADINASGLPGPFTKMSWNTLSADGPGSYTMSLKYDPSEDILVASQVGHGIWVYSFNGSLGPRAVSSQLVSTSDLTLPQLAQPVLNKRGEEINSGLAVSVNRELLGNNPENLFIDLHDFSAWRQHMELISPYSMAVNTVTEATNLLTEAGRATFGATLLPDGSLRVPLTLGADQTSRALFVNAREFITTIPTFELRYTVSLAGTMIAEEGRVILHSGSPGASFVWNGAADVIDPWSAIFDGSADVDQVTHRGDHSWIQPTAPFTTQNRSQDDVFYVGSAYSLATGLDGDDLFIVDDNTWGTNWLVGGLGRDEFRLVAVANEFPNFPQIIVDFEPGVDKIGLAGLGIDDLSFAPEGAGTRLTAQGRDIAVLPNVAPQSLQTTDNFAFRSVAPEAITIAQNTTTSVLAEGQELKSGEKLTSPNGHATLILQDDGNLVLYLYGKPTWASDTRNTGVNRAFLQADGALLLYSGLVPGLIVWRSDTQETSKLVVQPYAPPEDSGRWSQNLASTGPYQLVVQDDGNWVIYGSNGVKSSPNIPTLLEYRRIAGLRHA